ncbi:MAG: TldD/PmbA family protein [Lachnospiraceae bacterium]|nr:TldD/PmbA family protein [Lachnospiraceae bacterium]MBQ8877379.1 TldD/PmbA family protein [Lachnospiraceae bacterium]
MGFSKYLDSKRGEIKQLVAELKKNYQYVSVLGVDIKATDISVDSNTSNIDPGSDMECGFVIKMSNGREFYEYSLDDISEDVPALAKEIVSSLELEDSLKANTIDEVILTDEPLVKSFVREGDFENYTDKELLDFCKETCKTLAGKSEHILNAMVRLGKMEVSKLFISENRELDQNYTWASGIIVAIYNENEKTIQSFESEGDPTLKAVLEKLPGKMDKLVEKAHMLTLAKPIEPGIYDVITAPSITGLIAHEAFGHGVEMDQFVKDRALAKKYVGDYVASPICNMRDGAASTLSVASYFFDDDGVLAGDTQIIKDGILVTGLSDLASATQLGTAPTGNGRRESTRRKAYARMTNTFFEKGTDKLEDMIKSIDHGYMLFETNNGMEDPKNWAIQCVAEYGIEIVDGKLTDNWVSPVVMSGYVPDLLKSISMVSDDFEISGLGHCGKGYKEWVRVSDGGPALKVRVKLG